MRAFLAAVLTAVVISVLATYVLGNLVGKGWHTEDPGAKPQHLYTYYIDA